MRSAIFALLSSSTGCVWRAKATPRSGCGGCCRHQPQARDRAAVCGERKLATQRQISAGASQRSAAVVVVLSRNAAVAMAPGGAPQKSAPPRPPDKGSFPLDHFKECSDAKAQYMQCLKAHGMRTEVEECRRLSAAYLQCRMDTQLMAPQPINRLGFEEAARQRAAAGPDDGEKRARDGFIAGLPPKQANG